MHPARTGLKRNTPGIPTQKTPLTGRMKTTRNAAGDTAITARNATGDTAMPEGEVTPPMMTHPVQKTLAGGATGHAATGAETDAGATRPTRKATRPSRMRSVVARADTAGLLRGATSDGPR